MYIVDDLNRKKAGRKRSDDRLTPHQANIVDLVMQGKSNKSIAVELQIKPHCVRWHLKRIYRKCNVHNRTNLVLLVFARRNPMTSNENLPLPIGIVR